jgi:hypothetical protein
MTELCSSINEDLCHKVITMWGVICKYSTPSLIQLQLIQIETWKLMFICGYKHQMTLTFRKVDESLVCSEKTCQFLQTCIITFKNKVQPLTLLLMNKCIVSLQLLNRGSMMILFIYFHEHYLYNYIFHLFVSYIFLSFRSTICFTDPDYQLIWITSSHNYSRLSREMEILNTQHTECIYNVRVFSMGLCV